ncbi:MAG: RNA methyltransferase [Betaproteobacteria bacterium]|nr:MAG: RNA methyltransferase [Betaproteobacteria bacterium]
MISSRENARVKRWAKLMRDARLRRQERRAILEGPHLVAEALQARIEPVALLVSESGLAQDEIRHLVKQREHVLLSDAVFRSIADAQTPQGIAAEIALPEIEARGDCVFLEAVQDPSNVGAIIRTAAALGAGTVVLDQDCADAWSPKALRAGMGGHFKLAVRQVALLAKELEDFSGTVVCTVPENGISLRQAELRGRLGWVFGAEGRGLSEATMQRAKVKLTVPMAAGTESLNVAAVAAICLYEAFSRPAA